MVVFKLRFVFYSGRCNDGVINVWVWVGKAVTGRTRDHSLLEMETSLICCLGKENIEEEENLQKQEERKNWEKADSE